jgi:hypothetical protein
LGVDKLNPICYNKCIKRKRGIKNMKTVVVKKGLLDEEEIKAIELLIEPNCIGIGCMNCPFSVKRDKRTFCVKEDLIKVLEKGA